MLRKKVEGEKSLVALESGNDAEKAQINHSGELMQMQRSSRPQELWKDLCKYLMHSCALRFMEIKNHSKKANATSPMPFF